MWSAPVDAMSDSEASNKLAGLEFDEGDMTDCESSIPEVSMRSGAELVLIVEDLRERNDSACCLIFITYTPSADVAEQNESISSVAR